MPKTMPTITRGLLYLRQAHKAITRDFEVAFRDNDWNIAVRRAHESMEYAVKALYLLVGKDPPKAHGPTIPRDFLGRLPTVAFRIDDDPRFANTAFLLWADKERTYACLVRSSGGTLTEVAGITAPKHLRTLRLEIDGITMKVFRGEHEAASTMNFPRVPEGSWVRSPLTDEERRLIGSHVKKLRKLRDAAFYFDLELSQQEAEEARAQAWTVLCKVLESVGVKVPESGTR